jgi:hypothetical protein
MLENLVILGQGRKYPCRTREFYESLEDSDKEILMSLLSNPDVSDHGLSAALKEQAQVTIADTSLRRHRRGYCSCSKI